MTFSEIKTFLTANRFGITNPGTKKLSKILKELVDAIIAKNTESSNAVTELKTVYGFEEFSKTKPYSAGDLVINSSKLYKCKAGGHTAGDWDATHFEETTLAAEVSNLIKASISAG